MDGLRIPAIAVMNRRNSDRSLKLAVMKRGCRSLGVVDISPGGLLERAVSILHASSAPLLLPADPRFSDQAARRGAHQFPRRCCTHAVKRRMAGALKNKHAAARHGVESLVDVEGTMRHRSAHVHVLHQPANQLRQCSSSTARLCMWLTQHRGAFELLH